MRRIPRPQRAIDPSLPISPLIQRRIAPQSCIRAAAPHPHLRTTSACFSMTPTFNFLMGGKPDKKKHQAMVRRWQKRILGDSEPIGAHVDPYDPNSPVRIAPEEQGEEVEVLEGEEVGRSREERETEGRYLSPKERVQRKVLSKKYEEATEGPLLHVGGKEWIEHNAEVELAKEFEKLTMRTYTPMTQAMADEIERLTGTFYTLKDENLMMAQAFDEATGKPYTEFSFGRTKRVKNLNKLRDSFHQAVVEIHALKQAGKELDMSKQANGGIYDTPEWIKDVKLQRNGAGEFVLAFPSGRKLGSLLKEMERVPDYSPPVPEVEEEAVEDLLDAAEKPLAAAVEPPTMDPATPAFKREALIKDDPDKPKFDFMSNRPVPRKPKPAEPVKPVEPVEPVAEVVEEVVVEEVVVKEPVAVSEPEPAVPAFDINAALAKSSATISKLRHAVLESAVRSAEQKVASVREALRDSITAVSSQTVLHVEPPTDVQTKWQHVPLTDINLKFAISKRLVQLTGTYLTDPQLTSAKHLGDLYQHLVSATKPAATDVLSHIKLEGNRQLRLAKLAKTNSDPAVKQTRVRITTGDLLRAPNVDLRKRKESEKEKWVNTGFQKVVRRELKAKGFMEGRVMTKEEKERRRELRAMKEVIGEFAFVDRRKKRVV